MHTVVPAAYVQDSTTDKHHFGGRSLTESIVIFDHNRTELTQESIFHHATAWDTLLF